MPSSLFPSMRTSSSGSQGANPLKFLNDAIAGSGPQAVIAEIERDPRFQSFAASCKGKSMEQVARENGIDPDVVRAFLG